MKVFVVAGARPNFMKIAPLVRSMDRRSGMEAVVVHTGQHYDATMSDVFFRDLGLPEPHYNLGVGSGGHGEQTGRIMLAFEPLCVAEKPDLVLVVGDVNSTLACSIVATKLGIPVGHVEAGLRSRDRTMPEETNRIVTDAIADFLFTPSRDADENLKREGIPDERIFFVGNVMVDTLLAHREKAERSTILERLEIGRDEPYAALTLHRPSNVDDPKTLGRIVDALVKIGRRLPVVFAAHPRTRKQLDAFGLFRRVDEARGLRLVEPLGYLDFLALMSKAKLVLTDSGGLQEETTVLGVPCITLRENTERPVTVSEGTNTVAGNDPERIGATVDGILDHGGKRGRIPELWDGGAAERIISVIEEAFGLSTAPVAQAPAR